MSDKVNININGVDYAVKAGQNVLSACRSVGVEIPFFCYYPHLKVAGSCRMCLVSVGTPARDRQTGQLIKNEDGTARIAWMPKPAIACGTAVCENMHIVTDSEAISQCRQSILEFILLNHPLDCPICDKAGECKLQEYANRYGSGVSRYVESKSVKPKRREVAGKIMLDAERCILCSRCIRFCEEVIGKPVLGFVKRGAKTEISVYPGGGEGLNYLLNVVDICPVGALTEKAFRFKMRAWFLRTARTISAESSAGVNTTTWSRGGEIYRVTPRANDFVNGSWMSDTGRYVHLGAAAGKRRLSGARLDSTSCSLSYAVDRSVEILRLSGFAIVASAFMTVEEMFLLSELAKVCKARVYMVSHVAEDDGFLVSADRTPNMRGAFVTGLIDRYPGKDLSELAQLVESGDVRTVLCFDEDLKALGFEARHFKKANVIYCSSAENATSACAKVCVPLENEFEKSGMWINRQFRLQSFEAAVERPKGVSSTVAFVAELLAKIGGDEFSEPGVELVRRVMAQRVPQLEGCQNIPEEGMPIDGSAFSRVAFPEGPAFKYAPSGSK